MKVNSNRYSKY